MKPPITFSKRNLGADVTWQEYGSRRTQAVLDNDEFADPRSGPGYTSTGLGGAGGVAKPLLAQQEPRSLVNKSGF